MNLPMFSPTLATYLRIGALMAALIPVVAGCTPAKTESALQRVKREGKIRVGYANEAPYAYVDRTSGKLTGEAPEVLLAVMKAVGIYEVEGVLTEFGALIPGLRAGRFDVIAAGMYITPERCEQIAFSNPSYSIGEGFIVKQGNPKALHSYMDVLVNESATLGVMAGAVERGYARDVGIPDERVIVFPDGPSGLEAVRAGLVDAFAGTSLTVRDLLSKLNDSAIELAEPFSDPEVNGRSVRGYGAFGFRKEDKDLLNSFNGGLAQFIGTKEHLELVKPFGFTVTELPGNVAAADLCVQQQTRP